MAHKFDPAKIDVLDLEERKKIFPADKAVEAAGIRAGSVCADVGTGTGYLSVPAAETAGPNGRVYALDTSRRMLDELKKRVDGIGTIVPILSGEYDFTLEDGSCTRVIMANVFHEVDDPERFAREALRVLKDGGKLAVFEMKPGAEGPGPPDHHRIKPEKVKSDLEKAGFTVEETGQISDAFYFVRGVK